MKYPIMRLAHIPERILSRRLYLDLRQPSKYRVPETLEIPQPKARPAIPFWLIEKIKKTKKSQAVVICAA